MDRFLYIAPPGGRLLTARTKHWLRLDHLDRSKMSARQDTKSDRRRKGFKKTIDADDARRKREDNIIELRKAKRDENLQKKRALYTGAGAGGMEDSNRSNAVVQQKVVQKLITTHQKR